MLDKNHNYILDNSLSLVRNEFLNKNPNLILYSEPFVKAEFLNQLINSNQYPVIFLDFDLLYTGYVVSEMIKKNDAVEVYHLNKLNWIEKFTEIAKKISNEKILIVIDSFNGVYSIFDKKESGRFVNASLMLLSSLGRESKSLVIITAMARKNDNNDWILSPGGRQVIDVKRSGKYFLKRIGNSMILSTLNHSRSEKIFKINHSNF